MNLAKCSMALVVLAAATGVHLALAASTGREEGPAPRPRETVLTLNKEFACCDYGGNKVCIVNRGGKITWQMPAPRPQDIWVLPDGTILFTHVKGVKKVTRGKKIVWEYETGPGCEIHAAQPLPGGSCMIAESGPMRIIEVDRSGKITKEVKLTTRCRRVHGQMRGARKLSNGHYLVGQYSEGVLREYDGAGKIVWEFSQKPVFGGIRLASGNTIVSTGDGHRIIEVNKAGKVVWEIKEKDLPGNPLRFIAGMQLLPDGNLVVCNWGGHGHMREQPQIFEVTRDKKVVGVIDDWKQFGTISGVCILGVKGDATKFEINGKPAVRSPRIAGKYITVYRPGGDRFPGPDTTELKAGKWYETWVPNDHTILKGPDGRWHAFGITHPLTSAERVHEGEFLSFHAVAPVGRLADVLRDGAWKDAPKVLPPSKRPKERVENHAPYIVRKDGLYHMVYGPSPVRLATSPDLEKWTPRGELFRERSGARDPSILFWKGTYHIVFCSEDWVGLRTSRDLRKWSETKVILRVPRGIAPESPSLVRHQGAFYLFVCGWNGSWDHKTVQQAYQHKTYVYASEDPFHFDAEEEVARLESHAPEIFQGEDGQWYISSVEWPQRGVSIARLAWN